MKPDQTAPKDLVLFCLQYRLPKHISRRKGDRGVAGLSLTGGTALCL